MGAVSITRISYLISVLNDCGWYVGQGEYSKLSKITIEDYKKFLHLIYSKKYSDLSIMARSYKLLHKDDYDYRQQQEYLRRRKEEMRNLSEDVLDSKRVSFNNQNRKLHSLL